VTGEQNWGAETAVEPRRAARCLLPPQGGGGPGLGAGEVAGRAKAAGCVGVAMVTGPGGEALAEDRGAGLEGLWG